jgi:hypothetical protein
MQAAWNDEGDEASNQPSIYDHQFLNGNLQYGNQRAEKYKKGNIDPFEYPLKSFILR